MHQRALFCVSRGSYLRSRILSSLLKCKSCRNGLRVGFARQSRSLATLPNLPLFRALKNHDPSSLAIINGSHENTPEFTYGRLLSDVAQAKDELQTNTKGGPDALVGERVAILADNDYQFVVTFLSILASEAIAVPLNPLFPRPEWQYVLDNSQASKLLASKRYVNKARKPYRKAQNKDLIVEQIAKTTLEDRPTEAVELEDSEPWEGSGGLMLYTSGTTNAPKGVLIPQSALVAQAASLVEAWKYTPHDRLLHLLPLHHIHGTVNGIIAPLFAGSAIEFLFPPSPQRVWERLAKSFLPGATAEDSKSKISFLTTVPTMYHQLSSHFPSLTPELQVAAKKAVLPENLRLNISGSAALPTPLKQAWQELSDGNVLLERYGMTEVGMALSCGLDFTDRVDGSVGWPLPSVEVRLVDTDTREVIKHGEELDWDGKPRLGEIQLRGPTVFREYWNNTSATRKAFIGSGDDKIPWFKTGDIAIRQPIDSAGKGTSGEWAKGPMYFIQGRQSVDIIKSGGEKVSALEVERAILSIPEVSETAVVGLPSDKWGQVITAVLVLKKTDAAKTPQAQNDSVWGSLRGPSTARRLLSYRLARHKLPMKFKIIDGPIPRNAMGKVNKKKLAHTLFPAALGQPFTTGHGETVTGSDEETLNRSVEETSAQIEEEMSSQSDGKEERDEK
ncbi:AMP-binding enzyme [Aspergillus crustosus]